MSLVMNADEMLERATNGKLSAREQNDVAEALRSGDLSLDRYTLLLALGRSMAKRHRSVVESFLDAESDPMLARLALQILCKFWSETARYLPWIERALAGLDWDGDDDVRQMGISIAGEYLLDARQPVLLQRLLLVVDDPSEDESMRKDAYLSVARAMGTRWDDLPPLSRLPPLARLVDMRILEAARERLANETAS